MSENPTTTPPTEPADNGGTTGDAPSTTPPPVGQAPTWDGDFDPDRAKRLVENLRKERDEARSKLKAHEDDQKSDLQKAQESREELARELATLRKEHAAKEHGLPASLARFLTGDTAEEIAASAKALAEETGLTKTETAPLPGRPKPRLKPGHAAGDEATDFDPEAVIKAVRRGY
ncbi:hypothetical protein Acy02nite_68380 [Actinoplanes cyaneus]|uniref:Scaffolding protein n=1 Tax=Actinoplanes cyaneus TaxID=52696 RepID=A0A919IR70_9ACTN|nr:hypothetical protein [Actinoplanes cyaneus]MCW2139113.1 hypothetical protein [Actinoplanes cyaneus]GID68957.1 hypothetical protein Acy02nite_68380 [Actinoplanes cyaneus]